MRHMRSRRILAMLLALSMIFGLLTTTALADNGVDQNPSNVEESAANGTSEGGSGEGQSSGASEDESSKVTNKEDVPTEEETNPEEKKTTSSEEVDTQVGEGMEVPTATTIATDEALINAINNAVDGDTITLAEGQYQISDLIGLSNANKAVTISAETNATVILNAADGIALHGAKITFNGITFQWGTANYKGIQHASELEYNDCIINGKVFLYAGKETFNHCTFNQDSADYCVWTYGAAETTFNDCTFNCKGKAVLVYNEGYIKTVKVEVNNTTFAASETVDKKAAIELDTHLMKGASITVDNASTATGFSTNTTDGAGLWNAKRIDSENNETVEVVVGGEVKYTLTTAPVAMVNGVSYDKLEDAFAALSDKAYTLTLNDESAWDTATPVYWAAGTQSGYEATLAEALTAAYKANVGDITIICRPGADVGTMTHGHVADNLTIYGNDAYISGGECELEVDTFKFDRSTGKQATDGVTLDKDITITAYELDNLGVWGQRNTNNTVNVNLTDCDTVNGITVQRVYISGTTGVNNITLTGCDFETKATSVYSNADGDINITNCSFTGAQVPVNFNHKTDGEQTLRVSNCEFNACGDAGEWKQFAAPVRFVNSGSGKQSATVDTCTFTDTVGPNGDILIGDGRTGQESNDVNLTITDTEAKIQAQKPGYYKDDGTTDNALKGEKALTAGETLTVSKMEDLIGGSTGTKGTEANPYTLEELGAMTRADYIAAQTELNGTMYVSVGDYSYGKDGVLGNGVRDDTPGQIPDHSKLNAYGENGYLDEKNDGANGLNIVFVNGSITSGVTGYTSIDNIGTSLLLAVPAYTNVTFEGITFNNVMSFNYQLYTSPWSQLGELKFDGCTFNGIIVGATAAQTLTFNGCTFTNFTNTTDANSSNPTWIRPAYGNWTSGDNEGQGSDFRSLTKINFTNNKVTSTRPVKFEFISQWNKTTTLTATGNTFDISAQDSDTETKNVGLYIGPHTDKNAVDLVLDKNTKSERTAALYVIPKDMSKLPVGSTVKDSSGTEIEITDALEWKTDTKVTLKTETASATTNVAKVGDTEYATLEEAVAAVTDTNNTITLLTDVIQNTQLALNRSLTLNLDGHTIKNENDIWGEKTYCLLRVEDNAVVTITGNGTVAAKKDDCYAISITSGSLTIENGTFIGNISAVQVETGSLTIKDGTFKQIQESKYGNTYVINCIDGEFASGAATVAIYGGTFVGFDPNVSPEKKDENGNVPSFAAPGVGITKNADGTFSAASGMTAQLLDADGNSVKAYDSLAEAIAAAEAGQTVTLLDNVTDNIEIATDKNFTLDLNGHTINGGTGTAKATIMNCGTVKITDSSTDKTGTIKRDDNGTVGETSYYVIRNIGTMTIEQAIVTNNSGYKKTNPSGSMVGSSLICNGDDDLGGTLNISGGKIEQKNFIAIKNGALGKLNVTGGTISSDHSAIQNWFDATITGGEINGQLWTDAYIVNESVGHTTIGGSAKYTGEIVMDIYGSVKPELEISGGTLDVTNWRITTAASKAGAKPAVSGGKFTSAVPENYCADGYVPTKNEDGTYGVKETLAAKIGDTEYETLAAAFAAAKDGETIVLLKDSSGDGIVVDKGTFTDKGLIVDFNNHSYTVGGVLVGSSGTASNGFQLNMDNKITFKNGTLYGDASVAGDKTTNWKGAPAILIQNYCDLTLENMTVAGGKETCYTLSNNCGNTLIKNSTITAGEASTKPAYRPARAFDVCGFSKYPGATVTVENSTINGAVEISNGNNSKVALTIGKDTTVSGSLVDGGNGDKVTVTKDKSVDVTAPDGYKWVDGEAGQTLAKIVMVAEVNGKQYETLQAAIDAAIRNQTVKLIADTTENVTMETPYLTLDLNGHTLNGGQVKGTPALTVTARVTVKDSSDAQTGKIMREDTAENSGVSSHYVIDIQGGGWLTFESGNVTNDSGVVGVKGASLVRVGDDSVAKYPGLNIKGGSFRQDNFIAIKVDRGDLFLNGGTITSENSYAIENWFRTTIKGGIVNGTVASWTYSGGSNSTTTITGGTINGNVASVTYDKSEGKKASVSITGGTVTGTLGTYSYNNGLVPLQDSAKATIGVTGGTFDIDPTPYVVEGSTVKKNSEGKYGVEKAYLCQIGETKYYTMDEAFKAQTTSGEAIVLLRDYTTGSSFKSGSINRTVDLNNYTWTYTGTDTNCAAFEVNNSNVSLTVKNGKVVSNSMVGLIPSAMGGTITYDNSGLVFENVQATANGNSGIETNGNNTNDTVTLKDSTLNVPNGFGIYFPSSGTLTIDNSKITAKTLGVQVCSGSLDIKGQNAAITVNGDPVPKTENDGAIQDGAAISIVNRAGYKGLDKITVTEGTFKAKEGNAAVKAYNWANQAESDFTESNKVAISGGTFSSAVAPEYCAEGFEPKDNGDGTYGVQPDGNVAEIGSMKYKSLDEALKAAKDGETVKLLKDVEATQVLVTKGTLDLNGKTLKVSYFMSFSDVIDSTEGNGLIETGVQSFFTTNNSYLPLRDSAANGYRLFSYQLNKLGIVKGSPTAFWFNIVFGGKKAYSLLNTAGHNADLFIPMQIGSGNEWQYIKMNQSTLTQWTTPILSGTAPSKCGYYVNITGLDTLTSGTVLTLKTSIRSCGVEKLSDDLLTYTAE